MKMVYQPSIRELRREGESADDFMERILNDKRLLPDQRATLTHDFKERGAYPMVQAVYIEQAPRGGRGK
jgi:hypothetical protein